jgi:hypothetical protein
MTLSSQSQYALSLIFLDNTFEMAEEQVEPLEWRSREQESTIDDEDFYFQPGQIFRVTEKEHGDILGLHDRAYNHPCVVLSSTLNNGKCTILIVSQLSEFNRQDNPSRLILILKSQMTSLRGINLLDRNDLPWDYRTEILPIRPTEALPGHGIVLSLSGGYVMEKRTYVNTNHKYEIDFKDLRRYDDGFRRFTDESLKVMIELSGFNEKSRLTSPTLPAAEAHPVCWNLWKGAYTPEELRALGTLRAIGVEEDRSKTPRDSLVFNGPTALVSRPTERNSSLSQL